MTPKDLFQAFNRDMLALDEKPRNYPVAGRVYSKEWYVTGEHYENLFEDGKKEIHDRDPSGYYDYYEPSPFEGMVPQSRPIPIFPSSPVPTSLDHCCYDDDRCKDGCYLDRETFVPSSSLPTMEVPASPATEATSFLSSFSFSPTEGEITTHTVYPMTPVKGSVRFPIKFDKSQKNKTYAVPPTDFSHWAQNFSVIESEIPTWKQMLCKTLEQNMVVFMIPTRTPAPLDAISQFHVYCTKRGWTPPQFGHIDAPLPRGCSYNRMFFATVRLPNLENCKICIPIPSHDFQTARRALAWSLLNQFREGYLTQYYSLYSPRGLPDSDKQLNIFCTHHAMPMPVIDSHSQNVPNGAAYTATVAIGPQACSSPTMYSAREARIFACEKMLLWLQINQKPTVLMGLQKQAFEAIEKRYDELLEESSSSPEIIMGLLYAIHPNLAQRRLRIAVPNAPPVAAYRHDATELNMEPQSRPMWDDPRFKQARNHDKVVEPKRSSEYENIQIRVDASRTARTNGKEKHDLNLCGDDDYVSKIKEDLKLYNGALPEVKRRNIIKLKQKREQLRIAHDRKSKKYNSLDLCTPFEPQGFPDLSAMFSSLLSKGGVSVAEGFMDVVKREVGTAVDGVSNLLNGLKKSLNSTVTSLALFLPGILIWSLAAYKINTLKSGSGKWWVVAGISSVYLLAICPALAAIREWQQTNAILDALAVTAKERKSQLPVSDEETHPYYDDLGVLRVPKGWTTSSTKDNVSHSLNLDAMHPEIGENGLSLTQSETIAKGIALAVTAYAAGKHLTSERGNALDYVMRTIGEFPKFGEGSVSFLEGCLKMLERTVNTLRKFFFGKEAEPWILLEKENPTFENWFNECKELIKEANEGKMALIKTNFDRVCKARLDGLELCTHLTGAKADRLRNAANAVLHQLGKCLSMFDQFDWSKDNLRPEPFTLKLYGAPGVGKTTLVVPMITDVFARMKTPEEMKRFLENPNDFVYSWQPENEFAEEYRAPEVTVIDDFDQAKSVPGILGDAFVLIRAKNVWKYVLHMADLALKGKVKFVSTWIICTTNSRTIHSEAINSPEAVERRFDWNIAVVPARDYCFLDGHENDIFARRFDSSKLKVWTDPRTGKEYCRFDPRAWEFVVMDTKGEPTGEVPMTYFQFIEKLTAKYMASLERSNAQLKEFQAYGESLLKSKEDGNNIHFKQKIRIEKKKSDGKEKEPELTLSGLQPEGRFDEWIKKFWTPWRKFDSLQESSPINPDFKKLMWAQYPLYAQHSMEHLNWDELKSSAFAFEPVPQWWERMSIAEKEVVCAVCEEKHIPLPTFVERNAEFIHLLSGKPQFTEQMRTVANAMQYSGEHRFLQVDITTSVHDVYCRLKDTLSDYWKATKEWVQQHPVLTSLIMLVPIVIGIAGMVYYFCSDPDFTLEGAGESGSTDAKGDKKPHRKVPMYKYGKDGKLAGMTPHGGPTDAVHDDEALNEFIREKFDASTEDFAACLLRENLLRVYMQGDNQPLFSVLCVKGNFAIAPRHCCIQIREAIDKGKILAHAPVELATMEGSVVRMIATNFDFADFHCIDEWDKLDLCMIKFNNKGFPPRRDIVTTDEKKDRNRFFKVHQYSVDRNWDAAIVINRNDFAIFREIDSKKMQYLDNVKVSNADFQYVHGGAFCYAAKTGPGDCGSVLLVRDPRSKAKKIIGMHVAGNGKAGMASALCQEDILKALATYDQHPEDNLASEMGFAPQGSFCNKKFTVVRKVDNPSTIVGHSSIVPSKLIDTYCPHVTAPARLSPFVNEKGETVDPMIKAIERYAEPCPLIPEEDLVALKKCTQFEMAAALKALHGATPLKRRLTFEEAVLGIDPYLKPVPTDTSPGWPHEHERRAGEPGKTHWFGHNGINLESQVAKDLRKSVEEKISLLERGVPVEFVFKDFPKDERRGLARVAAGETRLISGSDIELLIIFRIMFGAFLIDYVRGRVSNGSAIGANPHGMDWEKLYKLLASINIQKLIAGDFIGMDTSTVRPIILMIVETINGLYYQLPPSHPDSVCRMMLANIISRSVHIFKNTVYVWHRAFPSGCPITALLNTFYLGVVFRWVYWRSGGKKPVLFTQYDEDVYMCRLGDDHVGAVAERAASWFNMRTIEKLVPIIGMKYADAKKNPVSQDFMSLNEVTFLKRSFRFEPTAGHHIGALELKTILEMPQWTKEGPLRSKIERDNFDTAMLYLSMHDQATFDKWSGVMLPAYQKAYGVPYIAHREDLLSRALNFDAAIGVSNLDFHGMETQGRPIPAMKTGNMRPVQSLMPVDPESDSAGGAWSSSTIGQPPKMLTLMDHGAVCFTRYCTSLGVNDNVTTTNQTTMAPTEQQATTTFDSVQVKETVQVAPVRPSLGPNLTTSMTTHFTQDLKTFLQKPIILASGTLSASDVGSILTINLPSALLSNAMYLQKVTGFQLMRGSIRIKLQMTSNQYQQGLYMLVFCPQGQVTGVNRAVRFINLWTVTQMRRVMLNISSENEAEMIIPYISPTQWHNLITGTGPHGTITLYVYSALATGTGGGNSIGYTIFGSFMDDLELANPTVNTTPTERLNLSKMRPQSRGIKTSVTKKNVSDKEAGSVTRVLEGVATIAGVAKGIPVIGNLAGTAEWVANILKGASSALGFSKPYNKDLMRVTNSQTPFFANNCDGYVNGLNMGQSLQCKLDELPDLYGTEDDEMSFRYVQQIFSWFGTFNFTTSNVRGDVLFSYDLYPLNFRFQQTDGSVPYYTYSPYAIFGRLFTQWRGAMQIRFLAVKTGWHQGKLVIAYYPGKTISSNPTLDDSQFVHKAIFDIAEGTEFTVKFPYTSEAQWLPSGTAMGCVFVYVLNTLVAPGAVAASTTWMLEVAGTEESMWNCPSDVVLAPYMPSTVALTEPGVERPRRSSSSDARSSLYEPLNTMGMEPQSGGIVPTTITANAKKELNLGGASAGADVLAPAQYCMGEQLLSTRQLVKMMRRTWSSLTNAQMANFLMRPHSCVFATSDGVTTSIRSFMFDYFGFITSWYAYNRGGVRIMPNSGVQGAILYHKIITSSVNTLPMVAIATTTYGPYGDNEVPAMTCIEAVVPGYARNPMRLTRFAYTNVNEPLDLYSGLVQYQLVAATTPTDFRLWRAAADDYSCGFFLGIPPIIEEVNLPASAAPLAASKGKDPAPGIYASAL